MKRTFAGIAAAAVGITLLGAGVVNATTGVVPTAWSQQVIQDADSCSETGYSDTTGELATCPESEGIGDLVGDLLQERIRVQDQTREQIQERIHAQDQSEDQTQAQPQQDRGHRGS